MRDQVCRLLQPYLYCCWSLVLFWESFVAIWWRFLVGGIDCSVLLSSGLFPRLLKLHKLAVCKLDLSRSRLTPCHGVLDHGLKLRWNIPLIVFKRLDSSPTHSACLCCLLLKSCVCNFFHKGDNGSAINNYLSVVIYGLLKRARRLETHISVEHNNKTILKTLALWYLFTEPNPPERGPSAVQWSSTHRVRQQNLTKHLHRTPAHMLMRGLGGALYCSYFLQISSFFFFFLSFFFFFPSKDSLKQWTLSRQDVRYCFSPRSTSAASHGATVKRTTM